MVPGNGFVVPAHGSAKLFVTVPLIVTCVPNGAWFDWLFIVIVLGKSKNTP